MGLWILLAALLGRAADAAVLIESVDERGGTRRVLIDERGARIDGGAPNVHMLVDLGTAKVYAVDAGAGVAVDLSTPPPLPAAHGVELGQERLPEVRLTAFGPGPVIAAYPTIGYRVTVAQAHCYDEYLAVAPLEDARVRRFVEVVAAASDGPRALLLALLGGGRELCAAAGDSVDDHYPALGIPMRTVRPDGRISHEITRVVPDAAPDPGGAALPAGYSVLSRSAAAARAGEVSAGAPAPPQGSAP